jgi:hypothetical protein
MIEVTGPLKPSKGSSAQSPAQEMALVELAAMNEPPT